MNNINNDNIITTHTTKNCRKGGFSLIELSIVLIILGLLVAGVTGGASLIKSAKIRSVCNDYLNYKNAYNTYYVQFDERPSTETGNGVKIGTEVFPKMVSAGIIDGANYDRGVMKASISNNNNGIAFDFTTDANYFSNGTSNVFLFEQNSILLMLMSLTSEEGKSVLKKIDDGNGNTGSIKATFENDNNISISSNLSEDITERKYTLYMKMDF